MTMGRGRTVNPRGIPRRRVLRAGSTTVAEAVMPYDYGATFQLSGVPGTVIEDVINVGADGTFVAMAIGYGLEEQCDRSLCIGEPATPLLDMTSMLSDIPTDALLTGFRVNPRLLDVLFETKTSSLRNGRAIERFSVRSTSNTSLPRCEILQRLKPPSRVSFLLSIVDTATGRELQDEPVHNLASLGNSDGRRPFRPFAYPITFLPRSSVRLQVIERSPNVTGTLFVVLYGYRIIAPGCPEPLVRSLRGTPACPVETIGRPSDRVVPFDYVANFELTGRRGNVLTDEIPIHVDGGFVTTALGYGLGVEDDDVQIIEPPAPDDTGTIDLGALELRDLPVAALIDGLRIRPSMIRLAFDPTTGKPIATFPIQLANQVFESVNRPEHVSFRYDIMDTGTGREMQNQPLNNIAGLGIANGDRPFKRLVRPMIFRPRSTIRVTVYEHCGRGRLFLVFQGYKVLGSEQPRGLG